jgi:serine protease Do
MKVRFFISTPVLLLMLFAGSCRAHDISKIVGKIKPSVVGVGVYDPLGSPRHQLQGTGFVIADGTIVATNYHVVEGELSTDSKQSRVVFIGAGKNPRISEADIIATDPLHDLALLRIKTKLTPLILAKKEQLADGQDVAFTGFPIGAILGLYPATHRGVIAAYTPVITPSSNASQLSINMLKRLREPYFIYQMDATAYPGNSGSPVYELAGGEVVAIINKVFVQDTKESAITHPSGISYSIPVKYLTELLKTLD